MQVQDLKVGDQFKMLGLSMDCHQVQVKCKLIQYNGMNKYVIESEGIRILVDGTDQIIK